MKPTRVLSVVLSAALCVSAQTVTSVPLPGGLPPSVDGPLFVQPSACAVAAESQIHRWTGLPHAPVYSVTNLASSDRMVGTWVAIAEDAALYQSRGPDGLPATPDDTLMIVRGLPFAAQLVPTGITGLAPDAFFSVNRTTAAAATGAGFFTLRHDAGGAVVGFFPIGEGLNTGPGFEAGPADEETATALGLGADGLPGTIDDRLVVLRGLRGPLTGLTSDAYPLPLLGNPEGFLVSDDGIPVVWRSPQLPDFDLLILQGAPQGTPTVIPLTVSTPANSLPPSIPFPYGVTTTPRGGIAVWNQDDLGPGIGYAHVGDLTRNPTVVGSWYDDFNGGQSSRMLGDGDVAFGFAAGGVGFTFNRFEGSGVSSTTVSEPLWNNLDFLRLGRGAVVGYGLTYDPSTSGGEAFVTLLRDPFSSNAVDTLTFPGEWSRVVPLGPGRVMGFLRSGGAGSPVDTLKIVSAPRATVEELTHPSGVATLQLDFDPALGQIGQAASVRAFTDPAWTTPVHFAFTETRLPRPVAYPGADGFLLIDPGTLFLDVPRNPIGGAATLTFPANTMSPQLEGQAIYVQAYQEVGAIVYLSDLGVVIPGL